MRATRTRAKIGALVVVTVVAYHYSLASLVQTIGLDTPLAYLGFVPLLAGGLAWLNRYPRVAEPAIFDRQLDYIIGLPLVAIAVLAQVVLPGRIGVMFWVNRLDLLFLPVFVAGATVLLFGVRVAWRQKVALAYLFLGWPWLYTSLLLGTLGGFTSLTVSGLSATLRVLHAATPVAGNPGLFNVVHHGHGILISVVTACSGVDGMVGFLLIGAALAAIVSGSLLRKTLWLATGLVVLWLLNLARLLLIFWVARVAGQHLALDVLHPVAGIAMFCLGVGIMSAMLQPFGLARSAVIRERNTPVSSATPRVFAVGAVLVVAALILAVSDGELRAFNPVASATGEPRLASFLADPAHPVGWTPTFETEYLMNKPLFGQDSRWFRYLYSMTAPGLTSLHSTLPVTADVIDAGTLSGFSAYGVTACYSFHGYTLRDVEAVDLGDGISGQALSYSGGTATSPQDWSIVYWIWPVETGTGTRYERVILYLQNTDGRPHHAGEPDGGRCPARARAHGGRRHATPPPHQSGLPGCLRPPGDRGSDPSEGHRSADRRACRRRAAWEGSGRRLTTRCKTAVPRRGVPSRPRPPRRVWIALLARLRPQALDVHDDGSVADMAVVEMPTPVVRESPVPERRRVRRRARSR